MTDNSHCMKHTFERAAGYCGECGNGFCEDCLLQPFPKRPPVCKACAMSLGGIRQSAAMRPARSKKELKALAKAKAKAQAEKAAPQPTRREQLRPMVNPMNYLAEADTVPAKLAGTKLPARTKRLWRAAG